MLHPGVRATPFRSGLTGAEVARRILEDQGISDVTVQETEGFLSDHYSPWDKTLNLSPPVYGGVNAAAAGVAAHEVRGMRCSTPPRQPVDVGPHHPGVSTPTSAARSGRTW